MSCCLLLGFLSSHAWAAEPRSPQEAQQQIQQLQTELKKLNNWLHEVKAEKSNVERQLESQEKSILLLQQKMDKLKASLINGEKQLGQLQRQQQQLQLSIQQQNQQIAAQLRAVYRSGEQKSIKFLLNGTSSEETLRLVHYNRYVSNARQSLINGFSNEINDLDLVERSIRNQRAQQARDQAILQTEQQALKKATQSRQLLLAKISQNLQDGDQKVRRLQQDQAHLRTLLKKLEEALADIDLIDDTSVFADLKGKLARPLPHLKVIAATGQVNLGGVSLQAQEGDRVNAIYHGRVIFSEWLRGFGFLLILDHGNGYMSLYGYNQSLLKEVGEWVKTNDAIATVGSSGGRLDAGLFFAIRHKGVPLNPLDWLRTQ